MSFHSCRQHGLSMLMNHTPEACPSLCLKTGTELHPSSCCIGAQLEQVGI